MARLPNNNPPATPAPAAAVLPASSQRWTVRLIRKKMELLGVVHAPDEVAAKAEAIREYALTDAQAQRLVITLG